MLRYIFTTPAGAVSIVNAAPKDRLELVLGPLTDEQYRAHVLGRSIPPGALNVRELADGDVIEDRTFRNAWEDKGGAITVNMPKAREIHRDHLRALRVPKLAVLDAEYMRALELNNTVAMADVAARKQALRNVTSDPAIDAAATPEQLKAVLPEALR